MAKLFEVPIRVETALTIQAGSGSSGGKLVLAYPANTGASEASTTSVWLINVNATNGLEIVRYNSGGSGAIPVTITEAGAVSLVNALTVGTNLVVSALATITSGIELGSQSGASTPYIDFHAGASLVDYDARVVCTSGSGTVGQGQLQVIGGEILLNAPTAQTASVKDVMRVLHTTSNTAAAGFGVGVSLEAENGSGTNRQVGSIDAVYSDPTNASEDGYLVFSTIRGGTVTEAVRIGNFGEIGLGGASYGTAGQVLTSGGTGAPPTWSTPSGGGGNTTSLDSSTSASTIIDVHTVLATTSFGTAAAGFGVATDYSAENAGGINKKIGSVGFSYTDPANASEDADFVLSRIVSGALREDLRVTGLGVLQTKTATATTNGQVVAAQYYVNTSGTPTVGFGIAHDFYVENTAGVDTFAGQLSVVLSDPTNGSEDSRWGFQTRRNGVIQNTFDIRNTELEYLSNTANTSTSAPCLILNTQSDGTVAIGFGSEIDIRLENALGTLTTQASKITTTWTDVTTDAESADMALSVRRAGNTEEVLKLRSSKELILTGVAAEPAAPAAGKMALYTKSVAGRMMLKTLGSSGMDMPLQQHFGHNKIARWNPPGNATTVPAVDGIAAATAVGTATARNVASTNFYTRARRFGYNSAATAGATAGQYWTTAQFTVGDAAGKGGFYLVYRFGFADTLAGAISFIGMSSSVAAPVAATSPATLTNCIGVGCATGDTNLSIYYGGSAAQTPIALGANFPAKTNATDLYELVLFAPTNVNNSVGYRVTNLTTGNQASGTLTGTAGVALPASTTFLAPRAYRTNNATASAVLIDIVSLYIETDT